MSCNHLSDRAGRWLAYAFVAVVLSLGYVPYARAATNAQATITIDVNNPGEQISPDLYGIFYEEISFGADGGLYAEMVQNRSFDYSSADRSGWNSLTSWTLVQRGDGSAAIATETTSPLNANNPSYLLAKLIADRKPRFMRFPGGCIVHGDSVANSYRWDYHQTYGLGFHEYFQFCEDIGAKPIFILSAAVTGLS